MSAASARDALQSGPRRYANAPRKGEERRAKLLNALERLLEHQPLTKISANDIAQAAGVTRSAFHYYFPTKAAAVAALVDDIYRDLLRATRVWHGVEGPAYDLVRDGVDNLVAYTRSQPRLLVAMFDAVSADAEMRELWERELDGLAARVAAKIVDERGAGRAPAGMHPAAIAAALVAMNERSVEREARAIAGGDPPSDGLVDALSEVWQRTIYGTA